MVSELVGKIRAACVGHPHAKIEWPHRVLHEAADRIEALSRQLEEAREALEQGFMTANSDGQTGRYEVVIKFRDIGTMQAAHGALVNFVRRAKETVSNA